ncbi:hypothetical protein [Corynebacterium hindlerae]|uniref:hypothetical protein n=1 Tax=Corynebacterium hindlerae TaxID=699041 RepID=UPI0031B69645
MLTDLDVYNWLDSVIIPSVSRESAKDELADADAERAVFSLAEEAFAVGALTPGVIDKLIEEYPEGWLNEVYVYFKANLSNDSAV